MSFLRHVGKVGDRKVAIIFRQVPGEPHMCLVTYTETLNRHIHDPMMACIESNIGQSSQNLADALNRTHTADGKYILQVLHQEGLIKKIQTSQVLITPNPQTKIKLDELNTILDEMEQGEAAIKRLQEMDNSLGMQTPAEIARRMRGDNVQKSTPPVTNPPSGILGDSVLANNLRMQAERMKREANGLLAESQRLYNEAAELEGVPIATQTPSLPTESAKRGRGRPKKATTLA
jgi:predicted transcriptional regulator